MATTITLRGYPTGAVDVYAYYLDQSLDDYVADKVLFVEGSGSDLGKYTAVVNETKGKQIVAFVGATQPASWADALPGVGWDLIIESIKADPDLGTAGLIANAQLAAEQTDPTALLDALGLESANLAHLVNAMIGTNIVEDNLDGTFDITVRNGDNTANLVTFRYDPITGNKTVIS